MASTEAGDECSYHKERKERQRLARNGCERKLGAAYRRIKQLEEENAKLMATKYLVPPFPQLQAHPGEFSQVDRMLTCHAGDETGTELASSSNATHISTVHMHDSCTLPQSIDISSECSDYERSYFPDTSPIPVINMNEAENEYTATFQFQDVPAELLLDAAMRAKRDHTLHLQIAKFSTACRDLSFDEAQTIECFLQGSTKSKGASSRTHSSEECDVPPPMSGDAFLFSGSFNGGKHGWCFKNGIHGVGYYRDSVHDVPLKPAVTDGKPNDDKDDMIFFCVRGGHSAGVYRTWHEAEPALTNVSGAVGKKIRGWSDALAFTFPSIQARQWIATDMGHARFKLMEETAASMDAEKGT